MDFIGKAPFGNAARDDRMPSCPGPRPPATGPSTTGVMESVGIVVAYLLGRYGDDRAPAGAVD